MKKKSSKLDDSKTFAFLGVFLWILGFLIVLLTRKDDKYAMFYAKQGLILFIAAIVVSVVGTIIPLIGWFVILPVGNIILLVLWIIGWVNALSGKEKYIPWIDKLADKFNI